MKEQLINNVIDAIVIETVRSLPRELIASYENPPGRRPSAHALKVSGVAGRLGKEDAQLLIRDVVDAAVFSVLSLVDHDFKNKRIKATFERCEEIDRGQNSFIEAYRSRVDPGGLEGNSA